MKKFLLLLILALSSCESTLDRSEILQSFKKETQEPYKPHSQFESRDLGTDKSLQKKVQVALFLPFSGKNKELGWNLLNAASMSIFDNDLTHNIELVLIDSKDSEEEARKAFLKIVESNIKIVIGPIFSQTVESIDDLAKKHGITVISFSNNRELMDKTNSEGGVFLAGIAPETQVDRIVGYALSQGKSSFSIIAPKNQYGTAITALFKRMVKGRDGVFVTSEFYDQGGKDLDRIVNHAINAFVISPNSKKTKKDVIAESDRTYSQILMIPESGKILSKIVAEIKAQNTDERNFQIVGTNQWDDTSTFSDYNLIGGWFAAPENEKFRDFEKAYYQNYSKFPPRIASISYDMVAAVSKLIDLKKGQTPSIADFTSSIPSSNNGFSGIDGMFRFIPNGLVQRNLAVLRIGNNRFETIEKPTEKFLQY
jgi:branched-chain amino acid transport system substrate-binding protein